ncbi:hypothetical protein TNCV_708071 [Trichonephila clavipes]|nr:hypothetical protein TNCV_708071 [Trichonephila clavipes]
MSFKTGSVEGLMHVKTVEIKSLFAMVWSLGSRVFAQVSFLSLGCGRKLRPVANNVGMNENHILEGAADWCRQRSWFPDVPLLNAHGAGGVTLQLR